MSDDEEEVGADDVTSRPTMMIDSDGVLEIDRGQPVIMIVTFSPNDGDPDRGVFFSYTRPGSERPYVDDGYGQAKSRIVKLAPRVYRYTFSTEGFNAGDGDLMFKGEWDQPLADGYDTVVVRKKYRVRISPAQLI